MEHKKIKVITALLLLTVFIISCNFVAPAEGPIVPTALPALTVIAEPTSSSLPNVPLTEADVPRVSLEDALTALNAGAAVFVDVRSAQAYEASHIAGAISVPLSEIENDPNGVKLDTQQWIITYCT